MSNCKIIMKVPGTNESLEFDSNRKLDEYLWDNKNVLLHNASDSAVFYEVNKKSEVTLKLKNVADVGKKFDSKIKEAALNSSGGMSIPKYLEDIKDLAMGVGFSRLYEKLGNPDRIELPASKRRTTNTLTKEQQEYRQAFGRDVHQIIQAKIDPNYKAKLEVIEEIDPITKQKSSLLKKVEAEIDKMLSEIKERHKSKTTGKYPQFMTETVLVAKNIDPTFLDVIRTSSLTPSSGVGNIESVNHAWGRADLIVIDDDGNVFVYDFKNTGGSIEVGSEDNLKNEMNLASYSAVLSQWEVENKIGGFVEFGVNYSPDGLSVSGFSYGGIKPLYNQNVINTTKAYYPSDPKNPIEALNDLDDSMGKVVPDNTFMNQAKLTTLSVEQEKLKIIPVQEGTYVSKRKPNAKYQYFVGLPKKPTGMNPNWFVGNWLVGNTKEELEERLKEYITMVNESSSEILPVFKDIILDAINTGDLITLQNGLKSIAPSQAENIYKQIRYYITNKWTLLDSEPMIQNGFFVFQKPDSARIEVVMLDTHILNLPLTFKTNDAVDPRRSTLLGNFLNDSQVDKMFFMDGTVGDAVLMKAMVYFNQHPEVLNGNKIYRIKAVSTIDRHVREVSNKQLDETYKLLAFEYNKKYKDKPLQIRTDILMNDISAAVEICDDILRCSAEESVKNILTWKPFRSTKAPGYYEIEDLRNRLLMIQRKFSSMDSKRMNPSDEIQMAKLALQRGYMVFNEMYYTSEEDVGAFIDSALALEGTEASSMKESKSIIMRQLQQIISNFHDIYKQEFEKKAALWQNQYQKFTKEAGLSKVIADDFKYFRENWFVKDGDKIHQAMRLITENDPYWNGKPEEKKLYDLYLSFWNRARYGDDIEAIQSAKQDLSYYEIPLIRTSFKKSLEAGGLWNAVKGWFRKAEKDALGVLFDIRDAKEIYEQKEEEKLEAIRLPSYIRDFVGDRRLDAIEKNGTSVYETNMDIIALTVLAVGYRSEFSDHAMIMSNALRASTYYGSLVDGYTMDQILKTFDKQIASKMFLRSVIDYHNRGIAMLINWAKGITSTGTLAFSWKSFVRETIKGITDGWARTNFDEMYGDKFSQSEYFDALKIVLESAPKNIERNSFIMQLSNYFGMANFSAGQIVEASKSNYFGLFELGSDVMFITATWPDFIHRTAMLIAHLKHIGAFEAYSLDENGVLQYDMNKDQRFQTWLKYHKNESEIPESELQKYIQERDLYNRLLKDFDIAGKRKENKSSYTEGDLLPDALSPRTQDNLKTVADRLYGNYDDETKSIMQKSLLGSLFFQFKTYPLERLSQWFKSPTHINDINYVQKTWDDGSPVIGYIDEDGVTFKYGHVEDVDPEWFLSGRAWYIKVPNGHEVWGHINRIFAGLGYLLTHNQAEYKHSWDTDPYFRGQMALALYDTFFGVILAFLVHLLFGEETITNMKNEEWYTRWLYAVSTGMTQDGPVWSLMSSIIGNGAPPSLTILKQYMTNAASVLTGDASLVYGFANSLGATREFTSILTSD